jgi:HlyD family secretion protein
MKKVWIWVALGTVVTLALVAVAIGQGSKKKVTAVQLARVRKEDITSRVRAPGKIEPKTQVKVSADIMGKIVRLAVKEGDRVRRGQLMLQLDDTQYRTTYQQAAAALAAAQARLRESESAAKVADANYERQRALFEQKLLSQAEWDRATSAHESAVAALAAGREDVTRAQAATVAARDHLEKTRFLAPFDGVVSELNVEEGEIVITGTMNNPGTQILAVSDMSRMLVRADVDESDVVDMRVGQKARITVDALRDTFFAGTVTEIGNTAKRSLSASVEGQTNFEVKVVFDQDVPSVRPGMTADVEIETAMRESTLSVPIQAVVIRTDRELERASRAEKKPRERRRGSDAFAAGFEDTVGRKDTEITGLFVVNDGVARFVPARTGIASETAIEVFGEFKAGDTVVAGPYKILRELKPGAKVKPESPGRARR